MNEFIKKNLFTIISVLVTFSISYGVFKTKLNLLEEWLKSQQEQITRINQQITDINVIKNDLIWVKSVVEDIRDKVN